MNLPKEEQRYLYNGVTVPLECLLRAPKASADMTPHYHDYIEFLFGLDCNMKAFVGGEEISFGSGDLLIINSNVPHSFLHLAPVNHHICVKVLPQMIYFAEGQAYDVQYVLPFLQNQIMPYQYFPAERIAQSERIPQIFNSILHEWQNKEYGYEIAMKVGVLEIFLWTVRNSNLRKVSAADRTGVSFENMQLIHKSLDYINAHFATVDEKQAAQYINMSYSYYSRIFRRVVGKSFLEYLTAVRLNEAEKLLLSTSRSITEIAHMTGFASSSHLIHSFRRIKGSTPGQYRQMWKQGSIV